MIVPGRTNWVGMAEGTYGNGKGETWGCSLPWEQPTASFDGEIPTNFRGLRRGVNSFLWECLFDFGSSVLILSSSLRERERELVVSQTLSKNLALSVV